MSQFSAIGRIMEMGPVVPVLVVDELETAVPLARALVEGGLLVLEVTLRTSAALDAIKAMRDQVPEAVVGAGTVLTPMQLDEAARAGAAFAVSPGATLALLDAAERSPIPLLPGAGSVSEVMQLLEYGFTHQKFFPAEPSGGAAFLKALASPLPQARFCPTGGIGAEKAGDYLMLSNVVCVGGSWVAPKDAVSTHDWSRISQLARAAFKLRA